MRKRKQKALELRRKGKEKRCRFGGIRVRVSVCASCARVTVTPTPIRFDSILDPRIEWNEKGRGGGVKEEFDFRGFDDKSPRTQSPKAESRTIRVKRRKRRKERTHYSYAPNKQA